MTSTSTSSRFPSSPSARGLWPVPPLARGQVMAPWPDDRQPCSVETRGGAAVQGELAGFDLMAEQIQLRLGRKGVPVTLGFRSFRRLTLTTPWPLATAASRAAGAGGDAGPAQAQERGFVINLVGGAHVFGNTRGWDEQPKGVFLFSPVDDGRALLRQFVPRSAYTSIEFSASAEERGAVRWIHTPQALQAALDAQRHAPYIRLGDAVRDLGLISEEVLDQVVRDTGAEPSMPLGERLVARGLIERPELDAALALKMGVPLVDLGRFPADAQAARRLGAAAMVEHRVLPLMSDGARLVVAVDSLAAIERVRGLKGQTAIELVPVLAVPARLATALASGVRDAKRWAATVPANSGSTTGF